MQDPGWLDFGWCEWEAGWLVVAGPGVLLVDLKRVVALARVCSRGGSAWVGDERGAEWAEVIHVVCVAVRPWLEAVRGAELAVGIWCEWEAGWLVVAGPGVPVV